MRVPDIREEARRQSLGVAESRHAEDDQSFIDAISEFWVGRANRELSHGKIHRLAAYAAA